MDNVAVLIVSWDTYWPCNEPMYTMMHHFWKNCDWPFYLCTRKKCKTESWYNRYIYASNDSLNWTGLLRDYLNQINEEYVFFLLVDQWPTDEIEGQSVVEAVRLMEKNEDVGVVYFRENAKDFRSTIEYKDKGYFEIPFGESYRLCATPSVWRKRDLLIACKEDVSAWEFERIVTFAEYTRCFRVLVDRRENVYKYMPAGAILKAKWVREAISYSEEYGLNIDFSTLPVLSKYETWKWKIKNQVFDINPRLVVWVQNTLNKVRRS